MFPVNGKCTYTVNIPLPWMLWECIMSSCHVCRFTPKKCFIIWFILCMKWINTHQGMCFEMCKNWWPMTYNDFPTTSPQQLLSSENQTNTSHEVPPDLALSKFPTWLWTIVANNKELGWKTWHIYQMLEVSKVFNFVQCVWSHIPTRCVAAFSLLFGEPAPKHPHELQSQSPGGSKPHQISCFEMATLWICISLQCRFNWISALVLVGWWKLAPCYAKERSGSLLAIYLN